MNRKLLKAYLLKESLDRLWTYTYEWADVALSQKPALGAALAAATGL